MLIPLLPFLLLGGEDFITDFEYGQMLYKNPRGISCATCHGLNGEGKDIVSYKEDGEKITIKGTDIRDKSLNEIKATVDRNHPIMPKYYLTREEVIAIYIYIQAINNREDQQEDQEEYEETNDENRSEGV